MKFRRDGGEPCSVLKYGHPGSLSDEEWMERGRVRLFPIGGTGLPALTPWKPAQLTRAKTSKRTADSSSSMGTLKERRTAKEAKIKKKWEDEQRLRRRVWRGTQTDFKAQLDALMDDEDGHESMWVEIKAKKGCQRWCWTHRRLKGAIEFELPSGEVFLRGSKENQVFLLEIVKQRTDEYTGNLPKMSAAVKQRLSLQRQSRQTQSQPTPPWRCYGKFAERSNPYRSSAPRSCSWSKQSLQSMQSTEGYKGNLPKMSAAVKNRLSLKIQSRQTQSQPTPPWHRYGKFGERPNPYRSSASRSWSWSKQSWQSVPK